MFLPQFHHHDFDLSSIADLDLNIEDPRILSSRVRVARNLRGISLPANISADDRERVRSIVVEALNPIIEKSGGRFYSVESLSEGEQRRWIESHILFRECDRFPKSSGINRHWPQGRGFYCSEDRQFVVWVNEEDHLRIFSLSPGGNLGGVFERCIAGLDILEQQLSFARHEKWGYMASCLTNVGTGMRISIHAKLPRLAASGDLESVCERLNLSVRGSHGENSDGVEGVYDVSNKPGLGVTEAQLLEVVVRGIGVLLDKESELT